MLPHSLTILTPHPASAQDAFLVFCLMANTVLRAVSKHVLPTWVLLKAAGTLL